MTVPTAERAMAAGLAAFRDPSEWLVLCTKCLDAAQLSEALYKGPEAIERWVGVAARTLAEDEAGMPLGVMIGIGVGADREAAAAMAGVFSWERQTMAAAFETPGKMVEVPLDVALAAVRSAPSADELAVGGISEWNQWFIRRIHAKR